jgi:hypothetical protein
MTPQDLDVLADEVFALLRKHGIEAEMFTLGIRVPKGYYDAIKENFPNRMPGADFFVSKWVGNWGIHIGYPSLVRKDDET